MNEIEMGLDNLSLIPHQHQSKMKENNDVKHQRILPEP
jgi:hypothetical protein